jgi:hypothetical protein
MRPPPAQFSFLILSLALSPVSTTARTSSSSMYCGPSSSSGSTHYRPCWHYCKSFGWAASTNGMAEGVDGYNTKRVERCIHSTTSDAITLSYRSNKLTLPVLIDDLSSYIDLGNQSYMMHRCNRRHSWHFDFKQREAQLGLLNTSKPTSLLTVSTHIY